MMSLLSYPKLLCALDEGISDLFDGTVNKRKMLLKLDGLIVERENRKSLLMLYNNETMDRCGFRNFVEKYGKLH